MSTDGPAIYVPLALLSTWPRNYRRGHIEKIARSIQRFGFNQDIRIRERIIYAGNHAFLALRMLQEQGEAIPHRIVADPAGGWLVPCIDIGHLNQSEAEAYAIADNRLNELGENDDEALAAVLSDIAREDEDLFDATGFEIDDLHEMIGYEEPELDDSPEITAEIASKVKRATCPECGHEFPL